MVLTIELALMLVGGLATLWGAVWGVVRWVLSQFAGRDKTIEDLRKSLEAHKLYAAEHFATSAGLERSLGKVEQVIERLASRLDDLLAARLRPPGGDPP